MRRKAAASPDPELPNLGNTWQTIKPIDPRGEDIAEDARLMMM
jgi:hypothetical protein